MSTIPTIALIPSGFKAGKVYSVLPINGDGDLTFKRNDTGARLNKSGSMEQVAVDTPRLDHSDGGCPSLLLEPSSTNLATYSENYVGQYPWYIVKAIGTSGIPSPDGGNNATKIVINDGVDASYNGAGLRRSFELVPDSSGNRKIYTFSIFVKKAELNNAHLRVGASSANKVGLYFNLDDGSLLKEDIVGFENVSHSIKDHGDDWWRISMSFKSSEVTTHTVYLWTFKSDNYSYDAGDGLNGIYAFGAQLEKGRLTSYIPSPGFQPQTRAEDKASKGSLSSYISSTAGVLYGEFAAFNSNDNTYRVFSLSDGTGNTANRIFIGFQNTNTIYAYVGKKSIAYYTPTDATEFNKVALKYENGKHKLFVNGVQIGSTEPTAIVPSGMDRLGLDSSWGSSKFHAKVRDIRVYNTVLTDAELATLTT